MKDDSVTVEVPNAYSNTVQLVNDIGTNYNSADILHVFINYYSTPGGLYGSMHLVNRTNGGYEWVIQDTLESLAGSRVAIEAVLNEFICKSGVNYSLSPTPAAVVPDLGDLYNSFSFESTANPLPGGIVARCNGLWYSCINNGISFYYYGTMDIELSRSWTWYTGTGTVPSGSAKLRYVLMHELGHSLLLGHVNEEGESMHPVVTLLPADLWNSRDTITMNDVIGSSRSVNQSSTFTFNGCGINQMVPLQQNCLSTFTDELPGGENKFRIFPNPANESIRVDMVYDGSPKDYYILDRTGRTILSGKINSHSDPIQLQDLAPGIYYLHVTSDIPAVMHFSKY